MKRRFRACRRYNAVVATGTLTYARHTHPQHTTYRYEKNELPVCRSISAHSASSQSFPACHPLEGVALDAGRHARKGRR